jgi:type IV secretory pathway TraG/TraD family ATPase VirD4
VRFDVAEGTIEARKKMGKVFVFDPTGLAEQVESLSDYCVGWSPLDGLSSWDSAVRRANGLSEGLSIGRGNNEAFWIVSARQLLAPLLFAAARYDGTMSDVLEWLGTEKTVLESRLCEHISGAQHTSLRYLRELSGGREPGADDDTIDLRRFADTITRITKYADNTYTGIAATAAAMLEVFAYRAIQERCDNRGMKLREFLDGNANTLYICAPPSEQRLFMPLFTALIREVLTVTYSHNALHVGTPESLDFLLCLDEAGNIARLEDLDTIATTAAGNGVQLISVFHDMSQLSYAYDEPRAHLIANNHSGMIFLPGNRDPETNNFLVDVLRDEEVRGLSHRGWKFSDLRKMDETRQLCIYRALSPLLLTARRSYSDPELLRLSEASSTVPTHLKRSWFARLQSSS